MRTLNDLLDEAAARVPNRPFLVTAQESITFKEFRERVLRAAAGFWGRGLQKGQCVAIVHRNGPDFVTAYLALSRLGAIAVPINFMVQKPDELAYMLNDCAAVGAVTQKEFLKGLRGAAAKCPAFKTLWVSDAPGELSPKQPSWREENLSSLNEDPAKLPAAWLPKEEDVAAILYTSGTTGFPKGVMLTHKNFVTNCESSAVRMELTTKDVGLCILPLFHSFAWTGNFLIALKMGVKLVMAPSIAPAKPWLTLMGRHGVTMFSAVPQLYSVLAKEVCGLKGLVLKYWFFRKVRLAISGSAPLMPATAEAFRTAMGLPITEGYGLTETSPVATISPPGQGKPGSVGTAIPGVQVKIVSDDGASLPVGQEGEIVVKGDCVMKGYYNLPDATKEAFTADGYFKTGDIGALDADGHLYIRDRKKDMIIIKGLKVFSAQVEASFLEHPAVEEAAIIGIPDADGDELIKAFVVLRKGAAADKASLMQFARAKLDAYKRPRDIEIVESLPKNALQKVLKRDLRKRELEKRAAA